MTKWYAVLGSRELQNPSCPRNACWRVIRYPLRVPNKTEKPISEFLCPWFSCQIAPLQEVGGTANPEQYILKTLLQSLQIPSPLQACHHRATWCPMTNDCHAYLLTTSSRAERSSADVLDLKYDFPCVSRFLLLLCIKANFIKDYLKKNIDHFIQLLQEFSVWVLTPGPVS